MNASVEVEVEGLWREWIADVEAVTQRAARAALTAAPDRSSGSITVLLTEDEDVAELNHRFRGKAGPTNVLSFPAGPGAGDHLGDLALALGVCRREAEAQGKRAADHLSHLVVHGVLHLLGMDHQNDAEAEAMEQLERTVLAGLGVPDPYASQDDTGH